jgi:hypothetical protein
LDGKLNGLVGNDSILNANDIENIHKANDDEYLNYLKNEENL